MSNSSVFLNAHINACISSFDLYKYLSHRGVFSSRENLAYDKANEFVASESERKGEEKGEMWEKNLGKSDCVMVARDSADAIRFSACELALCIAPP